MGVTSHGIKYPETPDLPNVPDDIGGLHKLNQTTQTWLSQLDAANLAQLTSQNTSAATQEQAVTSASNNVTTATTRQSGQQTSINSIQTRNDSANTRLNNRDTSLQSEQSAIQGFSGQISTLTSIKGRGFLGFAHAPSTTIPNTATYTPIASITFNDPAPNVTRMYRALTQINIFDSSGTSGYIYVTGIVVWWATGTTFSPQNVVGQCWQPLDNGGGSNWTSWVDTVFTGVSASQWTLWVTGYLNTGSVIPHFTAGAPYDFMTLEDVGLQL